MVTWVFQGIEFDIRQGLWLKRWGTRPKSMSDALETARSDFVSWPKLLPVYGHRFLAADPCRSDNPVFSIMQTDIIYYGSNLAHYLMEEFVDTSTPGAYERNTYEQDIHRVEIWSDLVERNPDFLIPGHVAETATREIAATLRARANEPQRPF